jgi:hypothetical protein
MSHPSEEVIQEARWRLQLRGPGAPTAERYRQLSRQFQAESEFDSFGLRQCLLEMDRLAGAGPPGAKPGFRTRLGARIVPQLAAMGTPARAFRVIDAILRHQDRRQRELEEKLADLESRIKNIESRPA